MNINFIQFTPAQLSNVILKQYKAGSNFTQLEKTYQFDATNSNLYFQNDTAEFRPSIALTSQGYTIESVYDYSITVPATSQVYLLTELNEEQRSIKTVGIFSMTKIGCSNSILSYKINGNVISGNGFKTNVYFKK